MTHPFHSTMWALLLNALLLSPTTLKAQDPPTPINERERTINDLLYYPFAFISTPMTTLEGAIEEVTNTFGNCEIVNGGPGLHAGDTFDFSYRGLTIGLCYYDWSDDRTWYCFYFDTKREADQLYSDLVSDIQASGLPLTKDKIYGGMSNRRQPKSVFKWVYVADPVKVKETSSNIDTENVVGKYKVEMGVYKRKIR